ncbi:MAG: MYXO-CTERM sorting domain-containing protein [Phycisphaerales bacterium]
MLSRLSLALVSGLVLTAAASTAQAQVTTYTDATGDVAGGIFNPNGILDLVSMEVSNTATDISFRLTVNSGGAFNPDWGKYMIGIATGGAGDSAANGNGWGRPISMNSPIGAMNYWFGSWVDGGGGAELRAFSGSAWNLNGATYSGNFPGSYSISGSSITYTVSLASLGLGLGSTFYFDAYSSGGGGGDGAIDALANPNVSISDWGNAYVSGGSNPIYSYTVVPAPGAVALLGLAGLMARRRRR